VHENERVVKDVGEEADGKDGEGRRFEGKENGEGEERKGDEAGPSAGRPPGFVDGVGGGEDDGDVCSPGEFGKRGGWRRRSSADKGGSVVEQLGFREDVVCADEAEDHGDGEEKEDA
jgi:hypothetical protein